MKRWSWLIFGAIAVIGAWLIRADLSGVPGDDPRHPFIDGGEGAAAASPPEIALPKGSAARSDPEWMGPRIDPPSPSVDLAALQRALPDNSYWAMGAPTDDERVLEARAEARREKNRRWGRIQAGEASGEEIHDFFEAQRRLHQDYLDLCARILTDSGDQLPERDRGLYELGARMHRDRLAELPRLEAEAVERKRVQDERRRAWEAAGKTPAR